VAICPPVLHEVTYSAGGAEIGVEGGGMSQEQGGACLAEQVEGSDTGNQTGGARARTCGYRERNE